jgi:hypothetical protein
MALFEAAAFHVNRAQPNVFLYLASVYEQYAPIESAYSLRDMTNIRNNQDVRRIICSAAATLSMCRKNKLPSLPTIKPHHDFDPITLQESLKAPSTLYGKLVLRTHDSLAIAVPMNEFCYCLRSDVRDITRALYWMAWLFAYCREHKKQTKQQLVFANRTDEFVGVSQGNHPVWIFWEAIRKQAQHYSRPYVDVLYKMYSLRWSPQDAKSRQSLLIAAVMMVCEGPTIDTTPVSNESLAVANVLNGIPGWIDAISRTQKSFQT